MPRAARRRTAPNASAKRQKNRRADASPDAQRPGKRQKTAASLPQEDGTLKSTPKRSKYFLPADAESSEAEYCPTPISSPPLSPDSTNADPWVPDTDEESDDNGRKRSGAARKGKQKSKRRSQGKGGREPEQTRASKLTDLWREGVRTGLGPGKEVYIELPQARDPGSTPYEDHTIHPNTLLFLEDLKANNDRDWLKKHDSDYRTSQKDWEAFVEKLTEKIIEKDSTIPELPVKDVVFRIYRDVRFTNDPTPYKPHFSAAWSRTGRKGPYAAYYVHLEPGKCFVGSGLWMPEAARLALLRQDIDGRSERIKRVLGHSDIRREIFDDIPDEEKKVVKAFISQNQETALKTKPKGYSSENKNIELLRLRSFTLNKQLRDEDLLGPEALDRIASIIGIMVPFVTYLNSVVMPDLDENEQNDDDEEPDGGSTSS
ncbi:hypothetical protein DIZ76_012681 [Coccidioides immitis]|uniref:TIGR02453 family protein n=1 Tax=Coccidioides immitis RMSCC 3703 TaxID=454286 RepID=A0A0J8QWV0_COCIT|nr:hypothetical protein CISG_06610 [Coccidioides immitis RMSCC 3703]TPX23351.1 hypothetical protein DIZ76_012681 [Coccidioides immitis]